MEVTDDLPILRLELALQGQLNLLVVVGHQSLGEVLNCCYELAEGQAIRVLEPFAELGFSVLECQVPVFFTGHVELPELAVDSEYFLLLQLDFLVAALVVEAVRNVLELFLKCFDADVRGLLYEVSDVLVALVDLAVIEKDVFKLGEHPVLKLGLLVSAAVEELSDLVLLLQSVFGYFLLGLLGEVVSDAL